MTNLFNQNSTANNQKFKARLNVLKSIFAIILICLLVSITALGQLNNDGNPGGGDSNPDEEEDPDKYKPVKYFFTVHADDNEYMVRLKDITSISKYEYVLDGAFRIVEVNIETVGSAIARFIYAEPLVLKEAKKKSNLVSSMVSRAEELSDRVKEYTGIDNELWLKPVKTTVPPTTHAHTIDFRLRYLSDVNGLYRELKETFKKNKSDGVYRIKNVVKAD